MALTVAQIHAIASISVVTALSVVGAYVYLRKKKNRLPKIWTPVANVTQLFIYPLKSGRRVEIQGGECSPGGMLTEKKDNAVQLRDRSFVVYGENNNEFKTARTYPKLLLIETTAHDQDHVIFDAPNERSLYVQIPDARSAKKVQITLHYQEKTQTLDCGDEAASWISRFILDQPSGLRIGYHCDSFKRDIGQVHSKLLKTYENLDVDSAGVYSDLTSYLLLNYASFEELKAKSPEPVTVHHYRPNIYVKGEELAAFAEQDWDWIKIGDAVFRNVKPCVRCVLTTINPENGIRSQKREPLKTLETLNTLKDPSHVALEGKGPVMGIHLALKRTGRISVGDVVYVGKDGEKVNFD